MKTPYIAIDAIEEFFPKEELVIMLERRYCNRVLVTTDTGHASYADLVRAASPKNSSDEVALARMFRLQARHLRRVILPSLAAGKPVIVCRSEATRYAYHVVCSFRDRPDLGPLFWRLRKNLVVLPSLYIIADAAPPDGLDPESLHLYQWIRRGFQEFPNNIDAQTSRLSVEIPRVNAGQDTNFSAEAPLVRTGRDIITLVEGRLNRFV